MAPPIKPSELRLLDGTFRGDRHSVSPAVEVLGSIPEPPAGLNDTGSQEWREKAEVLKSHGLLQPRYLECLRRYCLAYEQFELLKLIVDDLTADGERFITTEKGFVVAHPALKDLKDWDAKCKQYLTEMGLTPSSSGKTASTTPTKQGVKSRSRA